mmetsp:Transcript_10043/g.43716  ORF Transcript_10043/g.43716 Transcript_10043/m.43716 type:complete len:537 (+) Transcript_10043:200-1810(+)
MSVLHVLPQPRDRAPLVALVPPVHRHVHLLADARRRVVQSSPQSLHALPHRARHAEQARSSLLRVGGAKHDAVAAAVADGDVGRGRGGALARAGRGRARGGRSIRPLVVLVAASADVVTREPRLLRLLHVGERALHGIRIRAGVEHDHLRADVRVGPHVPVGSHELGGYGAQRSCGTRVCRGVRGGGGVGRRRGDGIPRRALAHGAAEDVPGRRVHGGVRGALELGPVRGVLLEFLRSRDALRFGHRRILRGHEHDGFAGRGYLIDVRGDERELLLLGSRLLLLLLGSRLLVLVGRLPGLGLVADCGEARVVARHRKLLHGPALPLLPLADVLLVEDVAHLPDRRPQPVGVRGDEGVLLGLAREDVHLLVAVANVADFASHEPRSSRRVSPRLLRVGLDGRDDRSRLRAVPQVPSDERPETARDAVARGVRRAVRLKRPERGRIGGIPRAKVRIAEDAFGGGAEDVEEARGSAARGVPPGPARGGGGGLRGGDAALVRLGAVRHPLALAASVHRGDLRGAGVGRRVVAHVRDEVSG